MNNPTTSREQLWYALGLLGHLGFIIATPLVIFALIGRFLDKKYGTSPWLLLAGLLISLVISTTWVLIKTREITKRMQELESKSPTPARKQGK